MSDNSRFKNVSATVCRMVETGYMPHAVLIESNNSVFRDASADYLAAAIVCSGKHKPCGMCIHCQKALSGSHSDISVIGENEKRKNILVDDIRKLRADAFIKPGEADSRVFIIRNADTMNERAQNALLKVLEEPPATVSIILCVSSRSKLLTTVRSRLISVNIDGEYRADNAVCDSAMLFISAAAEKNAYDMLKQLNLITSDRLEGTKVFADIKRGLMAALGIKNGTKTNNLEADAVNKAAMRLTLEQIIHMCDVSDIAIRYMNENMNKGLACVRLSILYNKVIGL